MKKRILTLTAALLMTIGPAIGQVIITDGDVNHNRTESDPTEVTVMVPTEGAFYDQYKQAPLGEGVLLLAAMGAAYLLGKKRYK